MGGPAHHTRSDRSINRSMLLRRKDDNDGAHRTVRWQEFGKRKRQSPKILGPARQSNDKHHHVDVVDHLVVVESFYRQYIYVDNRIRLGVSGYVTGRFSVRLYFRDTHSLTINLSFGAGLRGRVVVSYVGMSAPNDSFEEDGPFSHERRNRYGHGISLRHEPARPFNTFRLPGMQSRSCGIKQREKKDSWSVPGDFHG